MTMLPPSEVLPMSLVTMQCPPLPMVTADISMARADREIRSKKEKSNQGYGVRACCDSEIHAIPGANESRGWPSECELAPTLICLSSIRLI